MLSQLSSSPYVHAQELPDPADPTYPSPLLPSSVSQQTPPTDLPVRQCPECSYVKFTHSLGVMVKAFAGRWVISCRDCGKHLATWQVGMSGWRIIGEREK